MIVDLQQKLREAQMGMEKAIDAYGMAVDAHADAFIAYRQGYGDAVKTLREAGNPVGLVTPLAQGCTASLKGELIRAEGMQRKAQMHVEAFKERLHAIKHIGRANNELERSHNGEGQ